MITLPFTKMHGLGNDYIYFDCTKTPPPPNPYMLSIKLSDRNRSIGGDGIVLIGNSEKCDYSMRIFNADGSEAQMCGNAIRCIGKFVYDRGLTDKTNLTIETKSGVKHLQLDVTPQGNVEFVTVDMGEPSFNPGDLPANVSGECINQKLDYGVFSHPTTLVSVGNPHAVMFFDSSPATLELSVLGSAVENSPLFPERINAEFIHVIDRTTLEMRVWERGSSETMACGTGACASAVAAIRNGLTERTVSVRLPGGILKIEWHADNTILMTGPAAFAFDGTVQISEE